MNHLESKTIMPEHQKEQHKNGRLIVVIPAILTREIDNPWDGFGERTQKTLERLYDSKAVMQQLQFDCQCIVREQLPLTRRRFLMVLLVGAIVLVVGLGTIPVALWNFSVYAIGVSIVLLTGLLLHHQCAKLKSKESESRLERLCDSLNAKFPTVVATYHSGNLCFFGLRKQGDEEDPMDTTDDETISATAAHVIVVDESSDDSNHDVESNHEHDQQPSLAAMGGTSEDEDIIAPTIDTDNGVPDLEAGEGCLFHASFPSFPSPSHPDNNNPIDNATSIFRERGSKEPLITTTIEDRFGLATSTASSINSARSNDIDPGSNTTSGPARTASTKSSTQAVFRPTPNESHPKSSAMLLLGLSSNDGVGAHNFAQPATVVDWTLQATPPATIPPAQMLSEEETTATVKKRRSRIPRGNSASQITLSSTEPAITTTTTAPQSATKHDDGGATTVSGSLTSNDCETLSPTDNNVSSDHDNDTGRESNETEAYNNTNNNTSEEGLEATRSPKQDNSDNKDSHSDIVDKTDSMPAILPTPTMKEIEHQRHRWSILVGSRRQRSFRKLQS